MLVYSRLIMMWDGINQRKFPRVSYKCRIRVSRGGAEEVIETLTENIGAGGICVVLDKPFYLFEPVSLEIYLEDRRAPICCEGNIVWVVKNHPMGAAGAFKYDTGVEFTKISPDDKNSIAQLVENILQTEA